VNLHIPDVAESLAKRRSKDKSRKALSSVKQARRAAKYRNTANNSEEAVELITATMGDYSWRSLKFHLKCYKQEESVL
jgi:hypothetical protein